MKDKWSRARCERELKDPKNWHIEASTKYLWEQEFEFYSVTFVRYFACIAMEDWELVRAHEPITLTGKMVNLRKLFMICKDSNGEAIGLRELSTPDAVEEMVKALQEEGYKI